MVIDQDTLQPLHQLSEEGKLVYKKMLENSQLQKNHPLKTLFKKVLNWLKCEDDL